MHTLWVENEWQEAVPRLAKYHLLCYTIFGKYILEKWLNFFLPSRKILINLIAVAGSQWVSIPSQNAKYIETYLQKIRT